MGIHCYIAKQIGDDQYLTVYCQFNGHPENTGAILVKCYDTPEKVDALLALGHLYYLREKLHPAPGRHDFDAPQPEVTLAYQSDGACSDWEATIKTWEELCERVQDGVEYLYVYSENEQWLYSPMGNSEAVLRNLKDDLENGTAQYSEPRDLWGPMEVSSEIEPIRMEYMKQVPREWLEFLREQYPAGSRIQLTGMGHDPRPIPPGSMGTLDYIDDRGHFQMTWDNGRSLALVIGEDRFTVHPPEPTLLKLYMPLTADFYPRDEWGDMSEEGEEWDSRTLLDYENQILGALVKERMPEEKERGLMHWYGKQDSLDSKVRSAEFTVEARSGRLWGVAECQVVGELTPAELGQLKDYISGQASDGWGEGFEQREIRVDGGELYVHLWNSESWSIQTEQERFTPKVAEGLPELCFSTLRTTGQLICIKRGESGYYPSDWDTGDKERNVELADELNENLGVTPAQRQAMEIGSMVGWDVPGADPAKHLERSGQAEVKNSAEMNESCPQGEAKDMKHGMTMGGMTRG